MQSLFSPSHLKELCKRYGLSPSKRYGQNYLISQKPIEKMIEAGELSKKDTVLEIGPGFGILTLSIAPLVKKVVAFEIEKKLMPYWEGIQEDCKIGRLEDCDNIEIVWGNALKNLQTTDCGLQSIVDRRPYKVLANLPYQITSHAIRTLLELPNKPERIVIMVQKEVAERITAKAGDMNLLGLSVQYYGVPEIVCQVPKGSFWPAPKVDSAVVAIREIKKTRNQESSKHFFQFAKAGFANKRKLLWRNMADGLNIDGALVRRALSDIGCKETARAQELGVEEWRRLTELLEKKVLHP